MKARKGRIKERDRMGRYTGKKKAVCNKHKCVACYRKDQFFEPWW